MPYQPFTITGSGGFSKLCAPPVISGAVACVDGGCWARFVHAPATVAASGQNGALSVVTDSNGFTDGWAWVPEGASLLFGTERVADTTATDPVAQIDIYIPDTATVVVNQH